MATVTSKRAMKAPKTVKLPPKRKSCLVAVSVKLLVDPSRWRVVGVKQV